MTRSKKAKNKNLSIIPLGGVGEIGKNMTVLRYAGDILVIDSGLMFPEEEMLGVDIVIPDISYLIENKDKVRGIVLTHGHEDHIGALPYVLRQLNVPVYGAKLTLGFVSSKLDEHHLLDNADLREIKAGEGFSVACFDIEPIRVSHSIPDSVGLAIRTPVGMLIHTCDFKFDLTSSDSRRLNMSRFSKLGDDGVLIMLSDCTNVEKKGFTPSESVVATTLDQIVSSAPGRVIVAAFASNIRRIQQVYDIAARYERKVAVIGRSMARNCEIAEALGYLEVAPEAKLQIYEVDSTDPREVMIITTGSQGEPLSALTRMAMDGHKKVKITEGDTVIISATPIPGNEALVMRTINHLFRLGADVVYDAISPVHVSGHGNQEDLKLMLNLVRPKFVIPVHGEPRHMVKYRELAVSMGYAPESVIKLSIGDILETDGEKANISGKIADFGSIMVDGIGVGDVSDVVLRDRRHLSQDGIILVVMSIDSNTGEVAAGPDIISRGFVQLEQAEDLLEEAKSVVLDEVSSLSKEDATEWATVKSDVRSALAKFLYERTRRRPMVVPVIMEV
ncbi:MAG: ribonuclease J [Armatimonadota bacterium]|nr:ribonuclease J [Armatimonadota bacterium]